MNISCSIQEQKMAYRIRLALSEVCDASVTQAEIERLIAARHVAMSRKKSESPTILATVVAGQNSFFLEGGGGLWSRRLILLLTMLLLGFGLLLGINWQQQLKSDEFAAFDVAMLTDDLPPIAYADRGFEVFLGHAE